MIQQILAFLLESWRFLICWAVLDAEHLGFIRRLGVPHRDMHPGWNWKWPILERAETEDGRAYAYLLDPQSLQTGDGRAVVLRLSVTCRVVDARTYVLAVYDGRTNIQDVAAGELGDVVASSDAAEVLNGEILPRLLKRVRARAKAWGMKVDAVRLVDAAQTRSLRLWQSTFQSTGQD